MLVVKNMPMPEPKKNIGQRGSKYNNLFSSLDEGDCILCDSKKEANSIYQCALKRKIRVKLRTLPDGKIGIWRINEERNDA
jgi:hypothetical protein